MPSQLSLPIETDGVAFSSARQRRDDLPPVSDSVERKSWSISSSSFFICPMLFASDSLHRYIFINRLYLLKNVFIPFRLIDLVSFSPDLAPALHSNHIVRLNSYFFKKKTCRRHWPYGCGSLKVSFLSLSLYDLLPSRTFQWRNLLEYFLCVEQLCLVVYVTGQW